MKKLMTLITVLTAGCAFQPPPAKFPAMEQQLERPPVSYNNGSLWQGSSVGLVDDFKARTRGDILTVVISETASASKEATTGTSRASSAAAGIPNLMGLETAGISKWMDLSKLVNASASTKFDGSGSTTRKENLNATITARVIDVLANGNLLIEGRRNVLVNNEDQIIVLTGTVRPRDITPDNLVNSTLIADARIAYSGKGIISDRQQPGWLMGIMDKVWPF
ncbi:MAG: flagellar basal body L-ring protein FlgH [Desulfobacteraceae bacterium]|nr:flagellar basal body L-ring protein FlgH [Desulfobacteraceae bacterium]